LGSLGVKKKKMHSKLKFFSELSHILSESEFPNHWKPWLHEQE